MYIIYLIISMLMGYLAGSINFAILVSRWAKGIDIRSVGNRNPGTANVGREVGREWAALVFMGDLGKGLIMLLIARLLFFPDPGFYRNLALFLTGMAAITGHCWPLYHQFRGGGGLATSIGIYMFFIPVEFMLTLLLGFVTVRLFLSKQKYPFGQLVPMIFVSLAPLVTILSGLFLNIRVSGLFRIGGYSWHLMAGVALLSVYILVINIRIVTGRFRSNKEG